MSKTFESLVVDVDWQKRSLLEYISDNFVKKPVEGKIPSLLESALQNVLNAYLEMADRFYLQFKESLKSAYEAAGVKNSPRAGKPITENDVPIIMQQALDKLVVEWERVYDFIAAHPTGRSRGSVEKLQLLPVINAAILDAGFSTETCLVIPELGASYSLGFFNYTDDILPLTVPLTRIRSPWEWTIFWHEIAGQKIRLLKNVWLSVKNMYEEAFLEIKRDQEEYPREIFDNTQNLSQEYKDKLDFVRRTCDSTFQAVILSKLSPLGITLDHVKQTSDHWEYLKMDLIEFLNQDLPAPLLTHTKNYFSDPSRPLLMLSFEELLDQTLVALPASMREKALADGWSTDWLEELFEDSFSTLNFDFNFLFILDQLLRRSHGGKDLRHPSREVRLAAALSMKLISLNPKLRNSENPPAPQEWIIPVDSGLQGVDIRSLEMFDPAKLGEQGVVIWQFAKKIVELHQRMKINIPEDNSINGVKSAISQAMTEYIHQKKKPLSVATKAEKGIKKLKISPFLLQNISKRTAAQQRESKKIRKDKIDVLLGKKPRPLLDYLELLVLKFYDVDFNVEIPRPLDFIYNGISYHTNSVNIGFALLPEFGFVTSSGAPADKVKIDNQDRFITKINLETIKSKGWVWL